MNEWSDDELNGLSEIVRHEQRFGGDARWTGSRMRTGLVFILALAVMALWFLSIIFILSIVVALTGVTVGWLLLRTRLTRKLVCQFGLLLVGVALIAVSVRTYLRYRVTDVMDLKLRELSNAEYPEDPSDRSVHYGQYNGRRLSLVRVDPTHFDFIFASSHPHVANVAIRNVDVSLMTPSLPRWAQRDDGLRRIALTDRQWNRQQVRFEPTAPNVVVSGGDGFEKTQLASLELAKNCLNAGLWEVLLFVKEGQAKALYYHGWFTFPLGHYRDLFERNTGLSYWRHWYYLEHWRDPSGTTISLEGLRRVTAEREVAVNFDESERVFAAGEQLRKRRTTLAENVVTWGDFFDGRPVAFASFVPPGRYSVNTPRPTEYWRKARFQKAVLRDVVSPATAEPRQELELIFAGDRSPGLCRFIVSGFSIADLPSLPTSDYPKGLYMPMGIGVPPFFQSYDALKNNRPEESPYFSLILDEANRWLDHHSVGIDGPVMHRDTNRPGTLHVYLLSYERHTLIGHFVVSAAQATGS